MQIDFKWFAIIALVVMVGAFAFGATSFSAAFDPVRTADANARNAQTQVQTQRDTIAIETYKVQQQAKLEAEKQQLVAQAEFENQRNAKLLEQMDEQAKLDAEQRRKELALLDEKIETERQMRTQQLAQDKEWARVQAAVFDWGGRVLAVGLSLAMLIAASRFTLNQIAQARAVFAQQQLQTQPENARVSRAHELDIELGRLNNRFQTQLEEVHRQITSLQAQLIEAQTHPSPVDGNGSGKDDESRPSGKIIPLLKRIS
jgi:hypothetical protein